MERPSAVLSGAGERRPVTRSPFFAGRSSDCELVIDDKLVSSRHAMLVWDGDQYLVFDFKSHNGLMVNGKKTTREVLRHGDTLTMGHTEWTFEVAGGSVGVSRRLESPGDKPGRTPQPADPPTLEPAQFHRGIGDLLKEAKETLGSLPRVSDRRRLRTALVIQLREQLKADQLFMVIFKPDSREAQDLYSSPPVKGVSTPWKHVLAQALRQPDPLVDHHPEVEWNVVLTAPVPRRGDPGSLLVAHWDGPDGPYGALYALLPLPAPRVSQVQLGLFHLAVLTAALIERVVPAESRLGLGLMPGGLPGAPTSTPAGSGSI